MPFRIRARAGRRRQWFESPQTELRIGTSSRCEVQIDADGVAPEHARLVRRRNRVIVVDSGLARRGTVVDGRRVFAPVLLAPGAEVELGEARLRVELAPEAERGLGGERVEGMRVLRELEGPRGRQYLLEGGNQLWVDRAPCPGFDRFPESAHLVPARPFEGPRHWRGLIEHLPPGIALSEALELARAAGVQIPLGARALVALHLAQAVRTLEALGITHGQLGPERVWLGTDGIAMLRPARPGHPHPTKDREAWGALARMSLGLSDAPAQLPPTPKGHEDWAELVGEAAEGVDPAPPALARWVRLALSLRGPPLVSLGTP